MKDVMKKQRQARRKIIRQWTALPRDKRQSNPGIATGVSCKNIRLSSAAANPLSRSHNQRADGDGWVGAG